MMKQHKWKLILSSALILLPAMAALLFGEQLPRQFATHWGLDGQANGWSGKGFFLWVPLFLLALHWGGLWLTSRDPKNADQLPKVFRLVIWIIPTLSLLIMGFTWFVALGYTFSALRLMVLLFGILFGVLGNFMPKIRRNSTLGIRVVWALESEENWNATHRFGGKVWTAGGLLILLCQLLPEERMMIGMLIILLPMAAAPLIYSWWYYRKQLAEGTLEPPESGSGNHRRIRTALTVGLTVGLLVFLAVIMFTGNVTAELGEEALTLKGSGWKELTLAYDAIDALELREEGVEGTRVNGIGSARLLLGIFQNEEFGTYTRYTYTGSGCAIVMESRGEILVVSLKEPAETRALYAGLLERIG